MGNIALKSCCKTSVDRESEEPPPWLSKQAADTPSIPEALEVKFRTMQCRENESLLLTESHTTMHNPAGLVDPRLQMHDAGLSRPQLPPPQRPPARTLADFHHSSCGSGGSSAAPQPPSSPSSLRASLEAGRMDEGDVLSTDANFMDLDLNRVLTSVTDRYYMLCHELEWYHLCRKAPSILHQKYIYTASYRVLKSTLFIAYVEKMYKATDFPEFLPGCRGRRAAK